MKNYFFLLLAITIISSCSKKEEQNSSHASMKEEWQRIEVVIKDQSDYQQAQGLINNYLEKYASNDTSQFYQSAIYYQSYVNNKLQESQEVIEAEIKTRNLFSKDNNSLLLAVFENLFGYSYGEGDQPAFIVGSAKFNILKEGTTNYINKWKFSSVMRMIQDKTGENLTNSSNQNESYNIHAAIRFYDALYEKPGGNTLGIPNEKLYQILKDDIRAYTSVYIAVKNENNLETILNDHKIEYEEEYQYEGYTPSPYDYLGFYYGFVDRTNLGAKIPVLSEDQYYLPALVGVWYRRIMDGTDEEIFSRLITVLTDYDKKWLTDHISESTTNSGYVFNKKIKDHPDVEIVTSEQKTLRTIFDSKTNKNVSKAPTSFASSQVISLPNRSDKIGVSKKNFFLLNKDSLSIYDLELGTLTSSIQLPSNIKCKTYQGSIIVSPSGNKIGQLGTNLNKNPQAIIIDLEDNSIKTIEFKNKKTTYYSLEFIDKGTAIATNSYYGLEMYRLDSTNTAIKTTSINKLKGAHPSLPVIYDNKYCHNIKTNESQVYSEDNNNYYLALNPSATLMTSGGDATSVYSIDKNTGFAALKMKIKENGYYDHHWLNDTQFVFLHDGILKVYDTEKLEIVGKRINCQSIVNVINGKVYALTQNKNILIWDPLN